MIEYKENHERSLMTNPNKLHLMKTNILLVAAKLFYEHGCTATSFEEIAEFCDITKPLITYHYGTKANLANEVYLYFTEKRKNTITEKIYKHYGSYDLQVGIAVENRLMLKILKEDKRAYRFYHECMNTSYDNIFTEPSMSLYNAYDRRYHLETDRGNDELRMAAISSKATAAALIVSYFSGKLNCSFEFLENNIASLPFRVIDLPQNQIDKILNRSKEILETLDFRVIPYFEVE